MNCPRCGIEARRFGKHRNGDQRFQCRPCGKTYTQRVPRDPKPLGAMRIQMDKAVLALRMLLEGNSIRSTERLTGVNRNTIMDLLIRVGENCKRFLTLNVHKVPVKDVQADEIWGFVGCKEKTRQRKGYSEDFGDAYCYVALERDSKMILAWHLGKRTHDDTNWFIRKVREATAGQFQLTTDGWFGYREWVPTIIGDRVDFAQLVKQYATSPPHSEQRYSPAQIIRATKTPMWGSPDESRISTSHVERANLTLRMQIRRLTRLTNAHSKKWENHEMALAMFFAYYCYCRVHSTIKQTPAMASGLSDHVWSVEELLQKASV